METIKTFSKMFRILGNERRLKIVQLCQNPNTVSEISKKLRIPLTRTSEYLGKLEQYNLISKTRNLDNSVTINSLIEINEYGEVRRR